MNAEHQFAYGAWRFSMWMALGLSYTEIDALVREGVLRYGMTEDEARAALRKARGER